MTKKSLAGVLGGAFALIQLTCPLLAQAPVKIKGVTPDDRMAGVWVLDSAKSDLVSPKIDSAFKNVHVTTRSVTSIVVRRGDPLPPMPPMGASAPPIALLEAELASRRVLLAEIRATELRVTLFPEGVSAAVSDSQSFSWVTDKKAHPIPLGAEYKLTATSLWKDGVLDTKLVSPTGTEWKRTLKMAADGNTLESVTQVTVDGQKFKYSRRFNRAASAGGAERP